RFDRLSTGRLAFLQVLIADGPASLMPTQCASRPPTSSWKREAQPEPLEIGGTPAARVAYRGRWNDQDYMNETVAMRHGERIYVISASFPADDDAARNEFRSSVAGVSWRD